MDATQVPQLTPEQVRESIRQTQQIVLDATRAWRESTERLVADHAAAVEAIRSAVPPAPTPEQVVEEGFAFASQLLEDQREFVSELVKVTTGAAQPNRS